MQRDHLFNRSTRPLLDGSPKGHHYSNSAQLKKKSTSGGITTDYKLHGFNDFNFVANQYKNFSNTHTGYPYGGSPPPSPIAQSRRPANGDDECNVAVTTTMAGGNLSYFNYNDDSGIGHTNNSSHFSNRSMLTTGTPTNYYEDENSINNSSSQNNIHCQNPMPNECNIGTNYCSIKGVFKEWTGRDGGNGNGLNCKTDSNREEIRRNTVKTHTSNKVMEAIAPRPINRLMGSGPFIFGVHSNTTCYTLPKVNNESVIKTPASVAVLTTKYSPIDTNCNDNNDDSHDNDYGDIYHRRHCDAFAGNGNSHQSKKSTAKENQRRLKNGRNKTTREKCRRKNKRVAKKSGNEIKCVVVGDGTVGKTNLILSYLEHRFTTEHVPTASDIYNFEVKVDDKPVQVTLCDTAGQDFFDPLRRLCYPDSDVFLLCFSVVKPDTFVSIRAKWAPIFEKSKTSVVLIGTQADLRTDPAVISTLLSRNEKPVSKSDAWDYATLIGAKYIETSSRANINVKEAFDMAIWHALMSVNHTQAPPLWKRLLCLT